MEPEDQSFNVQLYFSARDLKSKDTFSKSDPFLKFSLQKSYYGNIEFAGETQSIPNNPNPDWQTKIPVNYFFQMKQPATIEIFDKDRNSDDYIGKAQTSLGAIMGSYQQSLTVDLLSSDEKKVGQVRIRAEKVEKCSFELMMKWKGTKLKNVDSHFNFIDKSDPYLKFLKVRQDNTFIEVGRTEVIEDNLQPDWKSVIVPAMKLFNMNDPLSSFKVECWDYEKNVNKEKMIGELFIRGEQLRVKSPPLQFQMISSKNKKPGKLILENYRMIQALTFIDYLRSGLQLNLVAAIDFTASNGDAKKSSSLHFLGGELNPYQQVILSIWNVLQNYDSDKKIPSFGFGGIPIFINIQGKQVSHCFPINDNPSDPSIKGINNFMKCYSDAVNNTSMAGPTIFVPILQEAFKWAKSLQNYSYQVLLIITDGEIHDLQETKDLIIKNSNLPISIIIVGVGNSSFGKMTELDGDSGLVNQKGQKCGRDIVQFVSSADYKGKQLAQQLLKELPKQIVQYFKYIGRFPQPRNQ